MGNVISDLKIQMPKFEKIGRVRLISLMKSKPLDMGSVLRKKDEDQFYKELEEYAGERGMGKIKFEDLEDLLCEYVEASGY